MVRCLSLFAVTKITLEEQRFTWSVVMGGFMDGPWRVEVLSERIGRNEKKKRNEGKKNKNKLQ